MRIAGILMATVMVPLALAAADATAGAAVYRWVDEHGVVHFSELPNPRGSAERIDLPPAPAGEGQAPAVTPAQGTETQLEPQKSYAQQRRDERADRRRENADRRRETEAACRQRRQLLASLEPSTRVIVQYDDGTEGRMDDNERLEVLQEAKAYIAANCNR